jgi:hypothetical protein
MRERKRRCCSSAFLGADGTAENLQNQGRSPGLGHADRGGHSKTTNLRVVEIICVGYLRDQPSQGKGGFWTVEYYQSYFDVDTRTVRHSSSFFPDFEQPTYLDI